MKAAVRSSSSWPASARARPVAGLSPAGLRTRAARVWFHHGCLGVHVDRGKVLQRSLLLRHSTWHRAGSCPVDRGADLFCACGSLGAFGNLALSARHPGAGVGAGSRDRAHGQWRDALDPARPPEFSAFRIRQAVRDHLCRGLSGAPCGCRREPTLGVHPAHDSDRNCRGPDPHAAGFRDHGRHAGDGDGLAVSGWGESPAVCLPA